MKRVTKLTDGSGRSMKTFIVGFAMLACLIPSALDAVRLWGDRGRAIEASNRVTSNLTRSLAQHAQDCFSMVDGFLADSVARLKTGGVERLPERFEAMERTGLRILQPVTQVVVINAAGRIVLNQQSRPLPTDLTDREYFRFHQSHPELGTHVGTPIRNRVDGRWVIPLSRRVDDADGRFDGVVLAAIDMNFFQSFYQGFDVGAHGAILMVRLDGTLLVRRPFDAANIGRSLAGGGLLQAIATHGPVGSTEVHATADGLVRLNSYRQLEGFPVVVAVAQQKDEVLATWRRAALTDLVSDLGLVAMVALLGLLLLRRVGLHEAAQRAVAEAMANYRLLENNSDDMIFRLDLNLVRRYVSPGCRALFGYAPGEMVGSSPVGMIHPDDLEDAIAVLRSLTPQRPSARTSGRMRHRDGHWVTVDACFRLIIDPATGAAMEITGSLRDAAQRVAAEQAVRDSEGRYRLLAETMTDVIMRVGPDGRRSYVSSACRELVGYAPEELEAMPAGGLVHPDDQTAWASPFGPQPSQAALMQATFRLVRKDGGTVWVEARRRRLPGELGFIVTLRDVSERLRIQDQLEAANRRLEELARLDGLTGLVNRRRFDEVLDLEFQRAAREGTALSLIMVDVDFFKQFNDRYGHPAGDDCLRAVAAAVRAASRRPADVAARYGGEEIVLVLPNTPPAGAATVAEEIRQAVLELAIAHDASPLAWVTVSAGVATASPAPGMPIAALVAAADERLYQAKAAGRNRVCGDPAAAAWPVLVPSPAD